MRKKLEGKVLGSGEKKDEGKTLGSGEIKKLDGVEYVKCNICGVDVPKDRFIMHSKYAHKN